MPEGNVLHMRRVFRAPRERVFNAFTRAEAMRQWMCPKEFTVPSAEADFRLGGRFRVAMRAPDGNTVAVSGTYQEIQPPELLVFTWQWEPGHSMAGIQTTVRVELFDRGAETMMLMTHTGLPSEEERASHEWGWSGAFETLAALVSAER